MRRIRSKDTKPEMALRSSLHKHGYRFRLHAKDLPGKPDIVFRSLKKAIFVHGCFWHQHENPNCVDSRIPNSRPDYWQPKLLRNKERDIEHTNNLRMMGWKVKTVWECELSSQFDLMIRNIETWIDE